MNTDALENSRQSTTTADVSREHRDLLQTLAVHRGFLLVTANRLTDDQARLTPTASALSVGGLIKHVCRTEQAWTDFIEHGTHVMDSGASVEDYENGFRLVEGETLEDVVAEYQATARRTTELIESLDDLDVEHPLPEAPWFEPGATWSARRVLLHIIAETAQHAGHADIIRETIDGSKTMG